MSMGVSHTLIMCTFFRNWNSSLPSGIVGEAVGDGVGEGVGEGVFAHRCLNSDACLTWTCLSA